VRPPRSWLTALGQALAIATIAAAPRLVALDFGLPIQALHPDEPAILLPARTWADGEALGLELWKHPPLMLQLVAAQLRGAELVGLCSPRCDGPPSLALARYLSVAFGCLAALAAWWCARSIRLAPWACWLAALSVALSPLHVEASRYLRPDAMASAAVALALVGSVHVLRSARIGAYAIAGLGVGLAGASKYNAAVVCVCVAVAHFARPGVRLRELGLLAGAAAVSVVVFGVTLVGPWDGASALVDGLRYEWAHYGGDHAGFTTDNVVLDALSYLTRFGWGMLPSLALAAGGVLVLQRGGRNARVFLSLLAFPLVYMILLSPQRIFFARLMVPLIPALAVMTAVATQELHRRCVDSLPPRLRPALGHMLAVLTLAIPAFHTLAQVRALQREDTRLAARRWLLDNIPRDAKLALVPRRGFVMPPVEDIYAHGARDFDDPIVLRRLRYTHVIYSDGGLHRYLRSPERFPERVDEVRAWRTRIAAEAKLLRRFEHPRLPGADLFGSTSDAVHQPTIEIYDLAPSGDATPHAQ
jgi:hypothetical protein